ELKKAVAKRKEDRNTKGLVDQVVEGMKKPEPLIKGNAAFEEELKKAVSKRREEQERKTLKVLRAEAEAKSQQRNQSEQQQSQKKREEKEK
ncbi:hypothetical protein, partial [Enterococcus durans]